MPRALGMTTLAVVIAASKAPIAHASDEQDPQLLIDEAEARAATPVDPAALDTAFATASWTHLRTVNPIAAVFEVTGERASWMSTSPADGLARLDAIGLRVIDPIWGDIVSGHAWLVVWEHAECVLCRTMAPGEQVLLLGAPFELASLVGYSPGRRHVPEVFASDALAAHATTAWPIVDGRLTDQTSQPLCLDATGQAVRRCDPMESGEEGSVVAAAMRETPGATLTMPGLDAP